MDNATLYRDWVNNWLTVSAMADHYGKTLDEMNEIIEQGRKEHNLNVSIEKQKLAARTFKVIRKSSLDYYHWVVFTDNPIKEELIMITEERKKFEVK